MNRMNSFASFGPSSRAGVVLYFTMFKCAYFCILTDPQKLKCGKQTEHGNKFTLFSMQFDYPYAKQNSSALLYIFNIMSPIIWRFFIAKHELTTSIVSETDDITITLL
eukprot:SAG11_NODE_53_length_19648_cov_14.691902_21_plen_108_part_00